MKTLLVLVLLSADGKVEKGTPIAGTVNEMTCEALAGYVNADPAKPANVMAVCVEPPKEPVRL